MQQRSEPPRWADITFFVAGVIVTALGTIFSAHSVIWRLIVAVGVAVLVFTGAHWAAGRWFGVERRRLMTLAAASLFAGCATFSVLQLHEHRGRQTPTSIGINPITGQKAAGKAASLPQVSPMPATLTKADLDAALGQLKATQRSLTTEHPANNNSDGAISIDCEHLPYPATVPESGTMVMWPVYYNGVTHNYDSHGQSTFTNPPGSPLEWPSTLFAVRCRFTNYSGRVVSGGKVKLDMDIFDSIHEASGGTAQGKFLDHAETLFDVPIISSQEAHPTDIYISLGGNKFGWLKVPDTLIFRSSEDNSIKTVRLVNLSPRVAEMLTPQASN